MFVTYIKLENKSTFQKSLEMREILNKRGPSMQPWDTPMLLVNLLPSKH